MNNPPAPKDSPTATAPRNPGGRPRRSAAGVLSDKVLSVALTATERAMLAERARASGAPTIAAYVRSIILADVPLPSREPATPATCDGAL